MKKSDIPAKFYKTTTKHPTAKTVGTLIKRLQELPPDLKLADEVQVVVYNISWPNTSCRVEEYD
jgi:hypothetical protein